MIELIFATQNQNKVNEVRSVLPSWIKLLSLSDLNFHDELKEDFDTLEQNAIQKAEFVFNRFHKPCFAEDAGLVVDSLGGEPGVRSARYAGAEKSSQDNINLLLKNLDETEHRNACFKAVIAFTDGNQIKTFEGVCDGTISLEQKGLGGFGYDPVFIPKSYDQTFGELSSTVKHQISHRTKAMTMFISFIEKHLVSVS